MISCNCIKKGENGRAEINLNVLDTHTQLSTNVPTSAEEEELYRKDERWRGGGACDVRGSEGRVKGES